MTIYTVVYDPDAYHTSADCQMLHESDVRVRDSTYVDWHDLPLCKRCRERREEP